MKKNIQILNKADAIAAYVDKDIKGDEIKIIDIAEDQIYGVEGYGLNCLTDDNVFVIRVFEEEPVMKKGLFHK